MKDRELMQQALNALMTVTSGVPDTWDGVVKASQAMEALRARLAQHEPVLVTPYEFVKQVEGKD